MKQREKNMTIAEIGEAVFQEYQIRTIMKGLEKTKLTDGIDFYDRVFEGPGNEKKDFASRVDDR